MNGYEVNPDLTTAELVGPRLVELEHERSGKIGTTSIDDLLVAYLPVAGQETAGKYQAFTTLPNRNGQLQNPSLIELAEAEVTDIFETDFYNHETNESLIDATYDLLDEMKYLRTVADYLQTLVVGSEDERVVYLQAVLADYRKGYPADSFDSSEPGSAYRTERFLSFYAQRIKKEIKKDGLIERIDATRMLYSDALVTRKLQLLLSKNTRERMAEDAQRAPINVVDPLSSLLALQTREEDVLGSMHADTRTIDIDPFSIVHHTKAVERLPTDKNELDLKLVETVFHELIHFSTCSYYFHTEYKDEDSTTSYTNVLDLWPQFWFEGMTEKLAWLMTAEIAERCVPEIAPKTFEQTQRQYLTILPPVVGRTKKTDELHKKSQASYFEYRSLIDTLFARLDWQAAGVTPAQAERTAFRAFTEIIDPSHPQQAERKTFIDLINKAAHPGFWMKFTNLVTLYGPDLALDIVSTPEFDVHQPSSTPWIASSVAIEQAAALKSGARLRRSQALFEIYQRARASPEELSQEAARLAKVVRQTEDAQLLIAANDGLRLILEQQYKRRTPPDPAQKYLAIIFGGQAALKMHLVERPRVDTQLAQKAITNWIDSQRR